MIGGASIAARPVAGVVVSGVWRALTDSRGVRVVLAAEVSAYQPAESGAVVLYGMGVIAAGPIGTDTTRSPVAAAGTEIIRASDLDVCTRPADGGWPWPGLLRSPGVLDRALSLDPAGRGIGATIGAVELDAQTGWLDSYLDGYVVGGQPVALYLMVQRYDAARGLWRDVAATDTRQVVRAMATGWRGTEDGVTVEVAGWDALLSRPYQTSRYAGTGGAEGATELAGVPKPRVRGRQRGVAPVLVDRNGGSPIYQVTDGGWTAQGVYEGGHAGWAYAGDFADFASLKAAAMTSSQYATCTALGFVRTGREPAQPITLDLIGHFPDGTATADLALVVSNILSQDVGLTDEQVDYGALSLLSAELGYTGGWVDDGGATRDFLQPILRGLGIDLVQGRDGRLMPMRFTPPESPALSVGALTTDDIVSAEPFDLPASVSPPPAQVSVAHSRQVTVLSSEQILAAVSDARASEVAEAWRWYEGASVPAVANRYSQPNRLRVETALDGPTHAAALGARLVTAWSRERPWYAYVLRCADFRPLEYEIGQQVTVTYPVPGLRGGAAARIVGFELRADDDSPVSVLVIA
ncbi:hypothetical protein ACM64Y_00665 [Novispirillum sp. DQ9]|uniref:hypothetical protein n=1 Tax=Novispirillum sp. DQ9 TaxID=3398612 RepID=UPI003C7B0C7D